MIVLTHHLEVTSRQERESYMREIRRQRPELERRHAVRATWSRIDALRLYVLGRHLATPFVVARRDGK